MNFFRHLELPKTQAKDTSVLDVNVLNNESMSPLHLAVCCNNKDAVLELLNCKPILKGYFSLLSILPLFTLNMYDLTWNAYCINIAEHDMT